MALLPPTTLLLMTATLMADMDEELVALNVTAPFIARSIMREGTMPLSVVSDTLTPPMLQMLPI